MIEVSQREGKVTLALSRREAKNALDLNMVRAMRQALAEASRSRARVVVVRSAVAGYFSLGMDLAALEAGLGGGASAAEVRAACGEYVHLLQDLLTAPFVSIAEVAGLAVGGGVDLCASCDLVFASQSSAFSVAQLRKGVFPLTTSGVVSPRIGQREFLHWMLSGQNLPARKAHRLGLVSEVLADGELGGRVERFCEQILSYDGETLRLGIEALRTSAPLEPVARLDHLGAALALNCQMRGKR